MGLVYTVTDEGRVISNTGTVTGADKADLSTGTQTALGNVQQYVAQGNLVAGQPVILDFTNGDVTVRTAPSGGAPDVSLIAGIVLADATDGNTVQVVSSGFVTARRDTIFAPSSETYALPSSGTPPTTNTRALTNNTTFTDSGGGGNYSSNTNHWVIFDAGSGYTQKMTPNSFGFEATDFSLYDRLGIQVSTDGTTFSNFSWSWGQATATTTAPWGSSYASSQYDDPGSYPGWCFPGSETRAQTLNGGTSVIGTAISIPYRYVKYWFDSDSSTTDQGWNLTLEPDTPYTTNPLTVPVGAAIYLDNSDYTKISTDNTSNVLIGYCINENAEDNALFIRLA